MYENRSWLSVYFLWVLAFGMCLGSCGPDTDTGSAALRLEWQNTQSSPLRAGVLEGIVDSVSVTVSHGGQVLKTASFTYTDLLGVVSEIPAGAGRDFVVQALSGDTVVYAGQQSDVTIVKGQQATVTINMTPAYETDIYPPAQVSNLSGALNGVNVHLTWTASGDDWLVGTAGSYDLRRSDGTIQDANFGSATQVTGLPSPKPSGQAEQFEVTGLDPGTYHFALKAIDSDANSSLVSNSAGPFTIGSSDTTPPADILDLAAQNPAATTVDLSWHAPGDDGSVGTASQYDLRYSLSQITDANFNDADRFTTAAPAAAGTLETLTVTGLAPAMTYYFAIKAGDEVPNWSNISSPASSTTLSDDTTPPAAIVLVTGLVSSDSVELTWDAPGDDDNTGTAAVYDVRYSTSLIDAGNFDAATQWSTGVPAPTVAGSAQSVVVSGLTEGTPIWFAIKAADEVSNWSPISNVVQVVPQGPDIIPPAAIVLAAGAIEATSVVLAWDAPGDDGATGTATAYDVRYSTSLIDAGSFDAATQWTTNVPVPAVAGSAQIVTIDGLTEGTQYWFAIKASDEVPNWSVISNVLQIAPDGTAPAAIALSTGSVTSTSAELNWNAPGDDDNTGTATAYDVRYSTSAIDAGNFDLATQWTTNVPAPAIAGSPQTVAIDTLTPDTTYYFAIKAADEAGNISPISNVPMAYTDSLAPAAIVLSVGTVTATAVQLTWDSPGDDGNLGTAAAYDVRYSTTIIDAGSFDAAAQWMTNVPDPAVAGTAQSVTIDGLTEGTQYWFAVKTADEVPNWSAISNVLQVAPDGSAPSSITLSLGTVTGSSVGLVWISPGDDGVTGTATSYDVRYSTNLIDAGNFGAATQWTTNVPSPAVAGTPQSVVVDALIEGTQYWFAIKAADEVGNTSPISNVLQVTPDGTAPAAIVLSAGALGATSVQLDWNAPGDDDGTGTATSYDVRYSTSAIDAGNFDAATQWTTGVPAPAVAGTPQTVTIDTLTADTTYYFAIKAADEAGNTSPISNVPSAYTDIAPPADIGDLAAGNAAQTSIDLTFTAPGDDGSVGNAAQYDVRYSTAPIDAGNFGSALQFADGVPSAQGNLETVSVTGLTANTLYYFAVKTADEVPNWSNISNLPSATTLP
ncbi:MAG TPA: fibronectin type III domain-containing protein [Myxococcota bacterium]|nr:fibronectin type III domain-containing protein [Myxococcota bacterium]